MMTAPDVLGVLSLLDGAGLTAWVDGGWGVDALLGETTRDHGDLDLAVLLPQLGAVRSALAEAGSFHYPPPVRGTIAGRPVRCMDAGTQVRAHLGYQPTAKDRVDMGRLRERLGVELPVPYSSSRV